MLIRLYSSKHIGDKVICTEVKTEIMRNSLAHMGNKMTRSFFSKCCVFIFHTIARGKFLLNLLKILLDNFSCKKNAEMYLHNVLAFQRHTILTEKCI